MAKRRAPVMKSTNKVPLEMREFHAKLKQAETLNDIRDAQHGPDGATSGLTRYSTVNAEKRRKREKVITCTPAATAALESLFNAVGVKVVTVKERPDTDDPSDMLGPLLPNPYQDEGFDDDTEDNGGPDE